MYMYMYSVLISLPLHSLMLRLQKLKVLQVSNNALVSLPVIGDNCVIELLDVHSNKLHYLPENLFTHCPRYSNV